MKRLFTIAAKNQDLSPLLERSIAHAKALRNARLGLTEVDSELGRMGQEIAAAFEAHFVPTDMLPTEEELAIVHYHGGEPLPMPITDAELEELLT